MENYEGFQIEWAVPPVSKEKWDLEISTEDPNLWERLLNYRKQHGLFEAPAGALKVALEAARKYIDNVWAQSS